MRVNRQVIRWRSTSCAEKRALHETPERSLILEQCESSGAISVSSNPCIQIFPLERGKSLELVMGRQDETRTVDAFSRVWRIIMYPIWLSRSKVWIYDARVPQRQNTFSDLVTKTKAVSSKVSRGRHPSYYYSPLDSSIIIYQFPTSRHPPWTRREDRVQTHRARR
jgi:hypothetical protein